MIDKKYPYKFLSRTVKDDTENSMIKGSYVRCSLYIPAAQGFRKILKNLAQHLSNTNSPLKLYKKFAIKMTHDFRMTFF